MGGEGMNREWSEARKIFAGSGVFEDFEVHGQKLENKDGGQYWRVQIWRTGKNPPKNYCVSGNDVFLASLELYDDSQYPMRVTTNGPAVDIEEQERRAIFKAIATWEIKDRENATTFTEVVKNSREWNGWGLRLMGILGEVKSRTGEAPLYITEDGEAFVHPDVARRLDEPGNEGPLEFLQYMKRVGVPPDEEVG